MDMLRFATAGSVDDGKSTLIGRLLYDSKAIHDDQLAAVMAASANDDYTNLALLTDGLRAEREQGITIDVAYRYFATPHRKFIIADTPGHVQYTRNMVTGASTADLALILVDARKGMVEQSRRHAYLCSLLGVPQIAICVNKMDLVDWSRERFAAIAAEFREFISTLDFDGYATIPVSALTGDNVVAGSPRMPWYDGPSLLGHLERVPKADEADDEARFPIQYVIHHVDGPRYAGQISAGTLQVGQAVTVQPHGRTCRIAAMESGGEALDAAGPAHSVTIRLDDPLELRRGDMICDERRPVRVTDDVEATVCWMDETRPLRIGAGYTLKHTTKYLDATVSGIGYRIDVNDLGRTGGVESLRLNEIGQVRLRVSDPLLCDSYRDNRVTGSFILLDNDTNRTVAGGIIT